MYIIDKLLDALKITGILLGMFIICGTVGFIFFGLIPAIINSIFKRLSWFKYKDGIHSTKNINNKEQTLTIPEAENILETLTIALEEKSTHDYHPISLLQGYNIFQINTALKLRIANEFLILVEKPDFEKLFSDDIGLYTTTYLSIFTLFAPDIELDELNKLPVDSFDYKIKKMKMFRPPYDKNGNYKDERIGDLETLSSFGEFCKYIGSKDPNYWQKIYARIGLKYTSKSPKANFPEFL
ncbi:MAG: hypothetical protein JW787_02850 [Sedimentisphaerales bacterium]|nr:hypothetical protein [Sedimentisphaerales bacterium]